MALHHSSLSLRNTYWGSFILTIALILSSFFIGLGRMRAAVSIFDFVCPYRCSFLYYLKPIFHWKLGLCWVPNANKINTKNMKCTWPICKKFVFGTQCNLYSTDARWSFALGDAQNLCYLTQKIPTCFCVR